MRLKIYNSQDVAYCADESNSFYLIGTLAFDGVMTTDTEHIRQIDLLLPIFRTLTMYFACNVSGFTYFEKLQNMYP